MSSPAETSPEAQRLFFALWPEAALRARFAPVLRSAGRGHGRPVALENLHITLIFLGAVRPEALPCVHAAAAAVQGAHFRLVLDRIGYWPRTRVLWLGPRRMPPELPALVQALGGGLTACGFSPETRPYQAHLTLARKVDRAPPGMAVEPIEWSVERFCLVRSHTLPEGVRYEVQASWPLAGSAGESGGE